ncbi:MAG: phosphoenolpyruvate--protein phosphotransferase [Syntrophales bacterium]
MHHDHETMGLRTLEDISGLILHSHDLQETLDNIVHLVAKRMNTNVCSIYLLEDDGETLTLQASKGLSRNSVGKIAMKVSEGLTGLVIEQRGVVNIENAPSHPRYKYFKESGEEKFTSFLGIPLYERKTPVGVIVVQTREARIFSEHEISAIATIAYQISSIVINAKLLDSVRSKEEERAFFERELAREQQKSVDRGRSTAKNGKRQHQSLTGSAASPGFCWGKLYILNRRDDRKGSRTAIKILPRAEERKRFLIALEKAKIQTLYMEKRVAAALTKEDAAIFHSHLMIMEDRGVITRIIEAIDTDCGAVSAVENVVDHYVAAFSQMEDPYLRQRSSDMIDIGRRITDCLEGKESRIRLRDSRIIVADDILPSDMATLNTDKVLGIMTEKGDVNSHAAIMARSLGIPAVLGIEGLLKKVSPRAEAIIDGTSGHIYLNPDAGVKTEYERLQKDHSLRQRELEGIRDLPAITTDGCRLHLKSNIGLLSDIRVALANGAEGVGLYRTEFPYMARKTFPNRHEQFEIYKNILIGFGGLPVCIRTLDIGGDKGLPYFQYPKEENPFMGWRSIRVSLERQDIFREQLAAVLMASVHGNASIMFPMVSGVDEIRQIKEIIREVCLEMSRAGIPYSEGMKLGIMIEIPAAVQTAHMLIHEVDYFSIGTNDLIQYTMAADRNNSKVKRYYEPFHPAVLHSIKRVVDVAISEDKPVSICGEMASIPIAAVLLLGMGIIDFSLSAPAIPTIKQVIRNVAHEAARKVAVHALSLESADDIRAYLEIVKADLGL